MITEDMVRDTIWTNTYDQQLIGIVLIEPLPNRFKAYIGSIPALQFTTEKDDALRVARSGGRFFFGPQLWPAISPDSWMG